MGSSEIAPENSVAKKSQLDVLSPNNPDGFHQRQNERIERKVIEIGKRKFQDFITRCAWGEVWTRPHFDERTRRILVIGTMVALGRWEEFALHVRAALTEGGFSADDIKEIILQQAIYCGVPAANNAFKEAGEVIAEVLKTK